MRDGREGLLIGDCMGQRAWGMERSAGVPRRSVCTKAGRTSHLALPGNGKRKNEKRDWDRDTIAGDESGGRFGKFLLVISRPQRESGSPAIVSRLPLFYTQLNTLLLPPIRLPDNWFGYAPNSAKMDCLHYIDRNRIKAALTLFSDVCVHRRLSAVTIRC